MIRETRSRPISRRWSGRRKADWPRRHDRV